MKHINEKAVKHIDEQEWQTCNKSTDLLVFYRIKTGDRKARLCACATVRSIWDLLTRKASRHAVEISERYADQLVTNDEMVAAINDAYLAADDVKQNGGGSLGATLGAYSAAEGDIYGTFINTEIADKTRAVPSQCKLIRDIFGNPYHPVIFKPSWLSSTVRQLAESIYTDRAFDRMPILGDALEDARCNNQDVLTHCRSGREHARGCWVVDLILSKDR